MIKNIKVLAVISLLLGVASCTSGDPYATVKVNKAPSTSATPSVPKPIDTKVPETPKIPETPKVPEIPKVPATPKVPETSKVPETPKVPTTTTSTPATETEKFDATDQKIVDFIDQKVYEDAAQIKKITVESIQKLQDEKNIRMTKREFLARTYQIIRDNNMTSFYLAVARLLNEIK